MDVDHGAPVAGRGHGRVARGLDVAEARADHEQGVGVSKARGKHRVLPQSEVARVAGCVVVHVVLAAPRSGDGHAARLEPGGELPARVCRPRLPADDRERTLGRGEQPAHGLEVAWGGRRLSRGVGGSVGDVRALAEHVLRQRQDDRARPARGRGPERARHELGDPVDLVDLGRPLRERAEHLAVVELLECLAPDVASPDLADEEDERGRVLERGVHADRRLCRAGTARDKADARLPGELPVGLGHVRGPRLVTAGDETDGAVAQRVENVDVALAGNAERQLRVVQRQLVDEDPPARAGAHSGTVIGCSRCTDADCRGVVSSSSSR